MDKKTPGPADVRAARLAAGLTQQQAADRFGYTLTGWQRKEAVGKSGRALSSSHVNTSLKLDKNMGIR